MGTTTATESVTVDRADLESIVAALDAAASWTEGVLSGKSERALLNCRAALRDQH